MRTALFLLFASLGLTAAWSQTVHQNLPDGETILRNVENNYAGINDYTVSLEIVINMERLKVPPSKATMYFKKPDKVHFDATGFAMVPKQAVAFNFESLHERYDVEKTIGVDTMGGRNEYRLTLMPKNDKTRLRRVLLFVDPARWTPDSIRIPSLDGRMTAAGIKNESVDGHWLPAEITVTFGTAAGDTTVPDVMEEMAPGRRRPPVRGGSATIRYSGYKLNTGLSDELFKEEGEPKGRP